MNTLMGIGFRATPGIRGDQPLKSQGGLLNTVTECHCSVLQTTPTGHQSCREGDRVAISLQAPGNHAASNTL